MNIVDLFAGPGGADLGIVKAAPSAHVVGIESDNAACATRRAAGLNTVQADVSELDPRSFGPAAGLWASPPCQTFSAAGKQAGRRDAGRVEDHALRCSDGWVGYDTEDFVDRRTPLVLEPLRWVDALRPSWVVFEQVQPVKPLWDVYGRVFERWGYRVWSGVLNAADYGVPQTRKRAFLTARLDGGPLVPVPTHAKNPDPPLLFGVPRKRWVTIAEALGWGDVDDVVWVSGDQPNKTVRFSDEPAPTVAFGHDAASCRWFFVGEGVTGEGRPRRVDQLSAATGTAYCADDREKQWVFSRPSTTVVGSFRPDVIASPGYRTKSPRQDAAGSVRVTVQQAGVLQGFSADYPWAGSRTKQYEQVGNAVPPLMAEKVVETLLSDGRDDAF